jgi:ATP-binding cassette subfamily F protein 3
MNEETPDTGWVQRGPSVRTAYLPQIVRFAVPERSMLDTMLYECKCTPQEARDQLGAYGFCGEDVLKPVSALSGGELSRLRLCMLMRREINFLILDEPTNHLDIASREWIEDALSDYTQALLFVSHDRYFIEKFATRIWLLENGTITDYRGTYEQFREYRARQTALQQTAKAVERKKEPKPKPKRAPNTARQRERTEREIEKLEGQLAALDAESEANATDYQKLMELDAQKQALNAQLEALYEAWEALCE